jgi:hypothetical protein
MKLSVKLIERYYLADQEFIYGLVVTRSQGYKTKIGNQSQISSIWLAEMLTSRHFSQSDAYDLRLVSNVSFITSTPGQAASGGVHGRVVKVSNRITCLHCCEFETYQGQDLSCEEANQLACGKSVVLPRCLLRPVHCPEGYLWSSSTMESWYVHTIMSS